jgi:D-beta-D-heptose 7-phosphate kinase/D-beta-D-heptose 1-phosphate adenosyltransferase
MSRSSILVVGDTVLDRYITGTSTRISPEAPIAVVDASSEDLFAGCAANVARNVVSLGSDCTLISLVSKDAGGNSLRDLIAQEGIEFLGINCEEGSTLEKWRIIANGQQVLRLDFGKSQRGNGEAMIDAVRLSITRRKPDVVVLSDYAKGSLQYAREILELAKKHMLPTVVDPKGSDYEKYMGAYMLTPNEKEFKDVVGDFIEEDELRERAVNLCNRINAEHILVTRGASGMTLVSKSGRRKDVKAVAETVFDVTGAGDTVIASIAISVANGLEIEKCVERANAAASISVKNAGSYAVKENELDDLLAKEFKSKLTSKRSTIKLVREMKESLNRQGKLLVMTNGCFDVLHAGHVELLKQARNAGDYLVVAVNGDMSVRRLKGEKRPVNGLERRLLVLEALQCVDSVVSFDEDTPLSLYEQIVPDIIVKGGDYKAEDVVGYDVVTEAGGSVIIFDLIDGLSTTNILNSLEMDK